MKKLTMKEIAKLANVSQSTVSRVINGKEGVNEKLAKRVLDVINEVGFVPNKAAQTLKQNQSYIIGVCVTETYNPYFVELIDTLESVARNYGYNILLHNSKRNPILEWESMENFVSRQVDGIIFVPTSDYNFEKIRKLPIPVVIVTQNHDEFDSVGLDHYKAGQMVAEKFLFANHTTFGMIGNKPDEKFFGFRDTLAENSFTFEMDNYISIQETSSNSFMIRKDIETYLECITDLPFSSVFTTNDLMAMEFVKAIEERGIKVPEDISVIGFDDTILSKMMGISSIHQPIEEMVKTTMKILLDRIENKVSSSKIQIKLEPTLIERKSSRLK
ncbi:LacI family DNA-binding transcriptional regulator [Fervidibacillus albus]|uniref:LacI family transcriptional regulator n=1 Tax=Fervidibacillus albus TaxID=2980026 RepID=A0A9E8LTT0_9BACI|nr:LacI family DNA-binding transcriptional regulator [Fervidibacillus albus]WAA09396.1 LacI family transcriptional regulator [Fervidibacillus albus]